MYYGSEVTFWIDPRSAQNKKSTVFPEFPFTEVKLNGYKVDFEGFLEENTVLSAYSKNSVRGIMGSIVPNASAEVEFRFRVGYALHIDSTMLRCSYDNSTCYKAKALARIDSISASEGYKSGSQLLKISGYGFNSDNIIATVDGEACHVQTTDVDYFTCRTAPKETPSSDTVYVGQHGLKRRLVNVSTGLDYPTLLNSAYTETLALELEGARNIKDGYYGQIFKGFFKAPNTGRYRFYMSCDDGCQLWLSTTNKDISSATKILETDGTSFRNYLQVN